MTLSSIITFTQSKTYIITVKNMGASPSIATLRNYFDEVNGNDPKVEIRLANQSIGLLNGGAAILVRHGLYKHSVISLALDDPHGEIGFILEEETPLCFVRLNGNIHVLTLTTKDIENLRDSFRQVIATSETLRSA